MPNLDDADHRIQMIDTLLRPDAVEYPEELVTLVVDTAMRVKLLEKQVEDLENLNKLARGEIDRLQKLVSGYGYA